MRIQVSALTEPQLIWTIAKAEGYIDDCNSWLYLASVEEANDSEAWRPLSWSVAGPIIEREGLSVIHDECAEEHWVAQTTHDIYGDGPTPLIAAMRCFVAFKLGDEVEIPDGL